VAFRGAQGAKSFLGMQGQQHECHLRASRAGMKYTVRVSRRGPQSFRVLLGPSHVDVVARKLNDGGLIIQVHMPSAKPGPGQRGGTMCSALGSMERPARALQQTLTAACTLRRWTGSRTSSTARRRRWARG